MLLCIVVLPQHLQFALAVMYMLNFLWKNALGELCCVALSFGCVMLPLFKHLMDD